MTNATPSVRETLLDATLRFLESAIGCPGVAGVALLGSIATPKTDPKDVDVLLYVANDVDLAPLAGRARVRRGAIGATA